MITLFATLEKQLVSIFFGNKKHLWALKNTAIYISSASQTTLIYQSIISQQTLQPEYWKLELL